MTKAFPILYSKSKTGKIKMWEIQVIEKDENIFIRTTHGYEDGKQQIVDRQVKAGKNIGKRNETTIFEQACFNAESNWKKKKDANYVEDINDYDEKRILLPMKAANYHELRHKVKYPCYVQPKLNGVRCLSDHETSQLKLVSRGGKYFDPLIDSNIWKELLILFNDRIIIGDGELYKYGWRFQRILSAVKKTNEDTPNLDYWLYDVCIPLYTFEERLKVLQHLQTIIDENNLDHIKITPTEVAYSENDLVNFHTHWAENDIFEGIIVRNFEGLYICDYRSDDLLKYKILQTEEFEIVGGVEGEGLEEGCVIFQCKTKDGNVFKCKPEGEREERREWFKNLDSLIGKLLTIEFKEYSDNGIPVPNPVGVAIRDYE